MQKQWEINSLELERIANYSMKLSSVPYWIVIDWSEQTLGFIAILFQNLKKSREMREMQKFKVTIGVDDDVTSAHAICADIEELCGVEYVSVAEQLEPEWKQKVREILQAHEETTIDAAGYVHGKLYTSAIEAIIKAGGLLMIHSSGAVGISNWQSGGKA